MIESKSSFIDIYAPCFTSSIVLSRLQFTPPALLKKIEFVLNVFS